MATILSFVAAILSFVAAVLCKANLMKGFGPRLRLWIWTLCQGQAFQKVHIGKTKIYFHLLLVMRFQNCIRGLCLSLSGPLFELSYWL